MIEHLMENGLSARAACRWSGYSRAVATYVLTRPAQDAARLKTLRRVARANPRYGYRRVAVQSDLGFGQTWRLWKQHDFRLAPHRRRPKRQPAVGPNRPWQADHPKHVWTYDTRSVHDRLADGRPFKTLSVLDEFTRECVAIRVAFSIRAEDVIALLCKVFRQRGAPEFLRSDNGSEFTAEVVQTWLEDRQTGPAFISPGHPWENGFIESFHDKFRDECLAREWFQSLAEAQVVIEKWRKHYNTRRPHSALGYQTPARFATAYKTKHAESLTSRGHKN
jgi:transposase InsO family protein